MYNSDCIVDISIVSLSNTSSTTPTMASIAVVDCSLTALALVAAALVVAVEVSGIVVAKDDNNRASTLNKTLNASTRLSFYTYTYHAHIYY